ncbi:MerR family transcriptional regulator [Clostridiaceae bacterium 35-E11]
MDIDKEKKYSISQVSKITGYDSHVLRYYEDDFNLDIPRTSSNRRYYTYKEIEKFMYIKDLQNRGLTNKQIKLILEAPELLVSEASEICATKIQSNEVSTIEAHDTSEMIHDLCTNINNTIHSNIKNILQETKFEIIDHFDNAIKGKEDIENNNAIRKEKDVLICENAKLKMKVKEKAYEVAALKEKLNRLNQKKLPFWKRIFSKNSTA